MVDQKKIILYVINIILLYINNASADLKLCRFNSPHIKEITRLEVRDYWNQLTGYFCYMYNHESRYNFKYRIYLTTINGSTIYFSKPDNNTYFFYDYLNETSLNYIKQSFRNELFFEKWKTCSQEAAECCDNVMTNNNIYPNDEYPCPAMWDSWTCYNPTKANTIVTNSCPVASFSGESLSCELTSKKECLPEGYWTTSTDYTECSIAPVLRKRHNFHITILAISAILSFPAIIIFFSFNSLRQKLTFFLHRNLILIIILRNILTIITKEIIIMDELESEDENTIMQENSVGCRVLAFFENLSKNGIFVCMFLDGFYLHKNIVRPFTQEPKKIYLLLAAFVFSVTPSLIWALLRGLHDGGYCWLIDDSQDQWVSDGFRLTILILNTLLLMDIIRVMILKLKNVGVSKQTKTTFRVTLFLIPLFGIHIIIISNRDIIPNNTCVAQDIYYYISYFIEGFQGIAVSFLFCYINPEVHREFLNMIRKILIYVEERFCIKENYNKRRPTTATYVESFSEQNY